MRQRMMAAAARARWCTERTALGHALVRGSRVWPLLLGLAVLHAGCTSRDDAVTRQPAATSSRADGAPVTASGGASAGAVAPKPVCPATGAWTTCSVVERLDRAGLAPREAGVAHEAPLVQSGTVITLGRSELRVFLYADRAARERDQARLDRRKYVSATDALSMQAEPTLITSENLLAILRSRSDHQRERVSDALTAGPPQRPSTKG